jgi:DNA polymerase-3 subunit epsilon
MKLHLERPLAIFDLETTGTDIGKDRIVEIAIVKIMPDGQVHKWPAQPGPEHRFLINPTIPIAAEATMVHGISNEMVQGAPTFADVAQKLFKFLFDCDLGGFNSNRFDIPLLRAHSRPPINFIAIRVWMARTRHCPMQLPLGKSLKQ